MKEQLEKLSALVEELKKSNSQVEEDAPQEESVVKEMTEEEFMNYAVSELEAAAQDSADVRKARLDSLLLNVEEIVKGWEGRIGRPLPVTPFKAPEQLVPTERKQEPQSQGGGAANFDKGGLPPTVAGGASAPGGKLVPSQSFGSSQFMKSLEKLSEVLQKMEVTEENKEEESKQESVEKNDEEVIWPIDLNSDEYRDRVAKMFGFDEEESEEE